MPIEYYEKFKQQQDIRKQQDSEYTPLKIACIFSPPGNISDDVKQMQEDLPPRTI